MNNDISPVIFYDIMKYPIPHKVSDFYWLSWDSLLRDQSEYDDLKAFSRDKPDILMSEYIDYIDKYWRLYKSIPFVSNIYLANSLTFNSLHSKSDIDLVIISKPWYIWLARFWSWLMFGIMWLRVYWEHKARRFCLSCYISADSMNLYSISVKPVDILFVYWIMHFVPLYAESSTSINDIYKANHRITNFLPNIKLKQNIYLGNQLWTWNTWFKEFIEKIWSYKALADLYNWIIWNLRLPILKHKTKKLWPKWWWIIHNDHILKFHLDIRKKIYAKYKIATNNIQHEENDEENTGYHGSNSLFGM
jgi:hypothetical protein